jgi:hypothetical protein
MWNHHHFLVRLTEGGLSSGMRALHSNYSRRLNVIDGETNMGHLVRQASSPMRRLDRKRACARRVST